MNTAWVRRWKENHERGSQLVELALVFVLLALLVAGVWDLGRMFRGYISVANAARDGARYAIRLPCVQSNSDQRTALKNAIVGAVNAELVGTNLPAPAITIYPDPETDGCPLVGGNPRDITITVSVLHTMWMSGITGLGDINLTARATMLWFGNDTG